MNCHAFVSYGSSGIRTNILRFRGTVQTSSPRFQAAGEVRKKSVKRRTSVKYVDLNLPQTSKSRRRHRRCATEIIINGDVYLHSAVDQIGSEDQFKKDRNRNALCVTEVEKLVVDIFIEKTISLKIESDKSVALT